MLLSMVDCVLQFGDTALHTAVRYGHAGVTRILISAKCNLDVKNKVGFVHLPLYAVLQCLKCTYYIHIYIYMHIYIYNT